MGKSKFDGSTEWYLGLDVGTNSVNVDDSELKIEFEDKTRTMKSSSVVLK